ncbi:uncharacterized protein [Palaemon carinicauda]|uniref:uncharacterized protein n=1 Tax=Palaemon carinicauda TaxID=392227 RepID=UPI0035B58D19
MKETKRQKLDALEMKCLGSMGDVSRLNRIRNEVVRMRVGVIYELAARADMNVLRGFCSVEKLENGHLLREVTNARDNGRCARGRPRCRWMDGRKKALGDRRINVREAIDLTGNRNSWRAIVTPYCYFTTDVAAIGDSAYEC